jgi:hypothetical protein
VAPMTPTQRVALVATALAVLLAPALYLALIAGAACLVAWRLLSVPALGEGAARGAVQEYVAWLVVSMAALALLAKPLVAPRDPRPASVVLTRAEARALFEFIERLCAAMSVRAPARIEMTCNAAIRMRLRAHPLSLLRGESTLTIGAAMMTGLSLRQFGGLVAREAGPLARRDVAVAEGIVRSVNEWLRRGALEADAWDTRLAAWGTSSGSLAMLLGGLGGVAAAAARGVLWALMQIARRASSRAARQMEASAEACQVSVAGSTGFDADVLRARQLESLWRAALIAAAEADRGRMPDNLPALTLSSERRRAPEARRDLSGPPAPGPAGRAQAPGIIASNEPAGALLEDFEAVCRNLTRLHYRSALGDAAPGARLVSTAQLAAAKAASERAEHACRRFFGGDLSRTPIPAPPAPPRAPADEQASLNTLRAARAEMAQHAAAAGAAEESLREMDRLGAQVAQAEALMAAAFRFSPAAFGISEGTSEAARWRRGEVEQMERAAVLALTPFTRAAARRLRCGLNLLHAAEAETRIADVAARRRRVARLWPCWRSTTRAMDAAHKLRIEIAVADALAEHLPGQWEKLETKRAAETAVAAVERRLGAVALALGDAHDPFGASGGLLRDVLVQQSGDDAEAPEILRAARQACDRLQQMYQRTIAELAEHAEAVERAVGLG